MIKAKAILWALSKAKELRWTHVVFKSDCKLVANALNERGQRVDHVQTVIDLVLF